MTEGSIESDLKDVQKKLDDIDVTFSDNQGNKIQNLRVYIEYFIQQGETNIN